VSGPSRAVSWDRKLCRAVVPLLLGAGTGACSDATNDPFPEPVEASEDVIVVGVRTVATLPTWNGAPARPMLLVPEPGGARLFVNDMWGGIYTIDQDGAAGSWLDLDDPRWGYPVEASGRERGFQSFALHPDFRTPGAPGYGKVYTWADTRDTSVPAHFAPGGGGNAHHTVLLEWTAENPGAERYDGGAPRTLFRVEQPYGNHNAGHLAFDPTASGDASDRGVLYVGVADGGSGGDPLGLAQDPESAFGKILRIDPLGSDGPGGRYGIPADNPRVGSSSSALPEIYASGLRNPQRFGWDPATGRLFVADIGQNTIEEISEVTPGANLGWNIWEGSYRYVGRSGVDPGAYRSDPGMTYPVVEFDRVDPLFSSNVAVTGVVIPRSSAVPALDGRLLFGDMVSGEILSVSANELPDGGPGSIRRVLLRGPDGPETLLTLLRRTALASGGPVPERTDLRFGSGPDGRIFLLNKRDGMVRELTP